MERNKGGRPKKEEKEKRKHHVNCYLNDKEFDVLENLKNDYKQDTSEILRLGLFTLGLEEELKKSNLLPKSTQENLENKKKLNIIGSNINQLARRLNMIKDIERIDQSLLNTLNINIQKTYSLLKNMKDDL